MASFIETVCDRILENESDFEMLEGSTEQLTDADVIQISEALEKNDKINIIELNDNEIGFNGLKHILDAASKNHNLEQIHIEWNSLEQNSDENINYKEVFALLKNTNVSLFDVSFTDIGEECINALIVILPFTRIRTLYISGNGVNEVQKGAIRKILLNNVKSYEEEFWFPWRHLSFINDKLCYMWRHLAFDRNETSPHAMVMTSLLCNSILSYRLPLHLWIDIFSFWKRKQFYIEMDDDDMSDGDIDDDMSDGNMSEDDMSDDDMSDGDIDDE
jgi:hypothetical protein